MGDTIDLHRNSAWPKMNENFDGVLKASRRDHQGGTTGTGGENGPTTAASSTVTASSSDTGPDMNSRGREERRQQKKERKRRDMRGKRREDRERRSVRCGGLGLKLPQNKVSEGHSRKMRNEKDITKTRPPTWWPYLG